MANSHPDRWRCTALLFACLLCLPPADAAKVDTETEIHYEGVNQLLNLNAGTMKISKLTLRQGPSTLIKSAQAFARGLKDSIDNSEWDLTGGIHIEFENTVLDADTATVVFSGGSLQSVHVKGGPAHFTHQTREAPRREGRATTIDYEARAATLRLAGGTWFFDGRNEFNTPALVYNLNDGSVSTDANSSVRGTIRPGNRIPTPRTPDRANAQ